jgi:hypothetical protein
MNPAIASTTIIIRYCNLTAPIIGGNNDVRPRAPIKTMARDRQPANKRTGRPFLPIECRCGEVPVAPPPVCIAFLFPGFEQRP